MFERHAVQHKCTIDQSWWLPLSHRNDVWYAILLIYSE